MKILERLSNGIGTGKIRGIYQEKDGRHFCTQCGKMMRPGQECIESWGPAFRRRATESSYHHGNCQDPYGSGMRGDGNATENVPNP